jgi:hypothetical protein
MPVDHSRDHEEHVASYNQESGQYEHPESLSDHIGQDVGALKSYMSEKARQAGRVIKNLTGEGEREDLFEK